MVDAGPGPCIPSQVLLALAAAFVLIVWNPLTSVDNRFKSQVENHEQSLLESETEMKAHRAQARQRCIHAAAAASSVVLLVH